MAPHCKQVCASAPLNRHDNARICFNWAIMTRMYLSTLQFQFTFLWYSQLRQHVALRYGVQIQGWIWVHAKNNGNAEINESIPLAQFIAFVKLCISVPWNTSSKYPYDSKHSPVIRSNLKRLDKPLQWTNTRLKRRHPFSDWCKSNTWTGRGLQKLFSNPSMRKYLYWLKRMCN